MIFNPEKKEKTSQNSCSEVLIGTTYWYEKLFDDFFQSLRHLKYRWANHGVFKGEVHYLLHFFAVGMGVFAAGIGPIIVNVAGIIGC